MSLTVRYTPPKIDARLALAAVVEIGVEAGGKLILSASQPLVPVESGELKASGKVESDGPGRVKVSYQRTAEDGYDVAIRQHEDATLHHPNGGEDHFLSKPFDTEGPAFLAAVAEAVRVIF